MKWIVRGVLLVAPLVAAVAVLHGRAPAPKSTHQKPPVMRGPTNWVPFSSSVTNVSENGKIAVGRFFRASDGSERAESGPGIGSLDSLAIKNIPQATFYLWNPHNGWTVQPMDLPPNGWRPHGRALNSQVTIVSDKLEGFSLIKVAAGEGIDEFQAPDLNFFVLARTKPCLLAQLSWCGVKYFNIKVGEQPAELFNPPSGEPMVRLKTPGGIVKRPQ